MTKREVGSGSAANPNLIQGLRRLPDPVSAAMGPRRFHRLILQGHR